MSGHVFVTRGDLRRMHCDAWLLPTDAGLGVTHGWLKDQETAHSTPLPTLRERLAHQRAMPLPAGWGNDGVRVVPLAGARETAPEPQIYLVNVGGVQGVPVKWYLDGVRQFVAAVAAHAQGAARVTQRTRPLAGLPLVGTGRSGADTIKGDVVRSLLATLHEEAARHDLDIVLVLASAAAFTATQHERLHVSDGTSRNGDDPWPGLNERLRKTAAELAGHADDGRLVLFLGAGVSRGAGLPSWDELLAGLAQDAGMGEREQEALTRLHVLDRARIIKDRLATTETRLLGEAVHKRLGAAPRYALTHSLLAALPVREAVTTNYDCLFEEASLAAGASTTILPYQPAAGQRWLLKMHGCVSHPQDIVLTRADYLRYEDRRAALAGIVQALLITRHMLFVGFSLSDDNFHQIVDEVRKAIRGEEHFPDPAPFGSALLLRHDALLEELWRDDLKLVNIAEGNDIPASDAEAARLLEIFLDYLLAQTANVPPLLDDAFEGILTPHERAIKTLLQNLEADATPTVRASPAWRPIAELLERYHGHHGGPVLKTPRAGRRE